MKVYLVDDCTPETIAVFSTFEKAMAFAADENNWADRIRVGELDSPECPETEWERWDLTPTRSEWRKGLFPCLRIRA